jgi:hypothetical protein
VRAKYLYTRLFVERSIAEIDFLLTLLIEPGKPLETFIAEGLLGRVRGVEIRFRDNRTPLRVYRADPRMTNAKEFIEAVIYRMSQKGDLDVDVISSGGKPLIRRILWKRQQHAGT